MQTAAKDRVCNAMYKAESNAMLEITHLLMQMSLLLSQIIN